LSHGAALHRRVFDVDVLHRGVLLDLAKAPGAGTEAMGATARAEQVAQALAG